MKYPGIQVYGSQNPAIFTQALRTIRVGLILTVVALTACGGDSPSMTAPVATGPATTPPFSVQLRVDDLDQLSDRCDIRVIASTRGGDAGAMAEWGILSGSSFDVATREFLGVSRTLPVYPDVFDAAEIRQGDEERGTVNLELWRRSAGVPVLVELEFHYRVIGDSGSNSGVDQVARLSHQCQ